MSDTTTDDTNGPNDGGMYGPCPDCGSQQFIQEAMTAEIVEANEYGYVEGIEQLDAFEVEYIDCADCGTRIFEADD